MKYLIVLTLMILSLNAQVDKTQVYAHIISQSCDLYNKPYPSSDKKADYFKKGDMVQIYYCDQYQWCKTKNGYLKKDALKIVAPRYEQPIIEKETPSPVLESSKENVPKEVTVELVKVTDKIVEQTHKQENVDTHKEYFSLDSAKVIFKDKE
ncbi:hypothetical protein KKG72_01050 [bacterium]|nr:hypothetical protein [bacterium]MBU1994926.1 hypothetical protein [bacterium]